MGETFSSAILDCGCTKTVCGIEWYTEFVKSLSLSDKQLVHEAPSKIPYKFGGNEVIYSFKQAAIPICIGGENGLLETEVVDIDLPLLMSKQSMKKTGMILNFDRDTATFNGQEVNLDTTSSGHYSLSLTKSRSQLVTVSKSTAVQGALMTINVAGKTEKERRKIVQKLHTQFGHPSHAKLAELVKLAGVKDESFLGQMKEYAENCETCIKYSRKNPRPVVGISLSNEFNSTIAMDLKQINKYVILHIIDLATRYSKAVVVSNKRKETLLKQLSQAG